MTLEEQRELQVTDVPGDQSALSGQRRSRQEAGESPVARFKHEQFGRWKNVAEEEEKRLESQAPVDLQLPAEALAAHEKRQRSAPSGPRPAREQFEFAEKTVEQMPRKRSSVKEEVVFKKRKPGTVQRKARPRNDDDD